MFQRRPSSESASCGELHRGNRPPGIIGCVMPIGEPVRSHGARGVSGSSERCCTDATMFARHLPAGWCWSATSCGSWSASATRSRAARIDFPEGGPREGLAPTASGRDCRSGIVLHARTKARRIGCIVFTSAGQRLQTRAGFRIPALQAASSSSRFFLRRDLIGTTRSISFDLPLSIVWGRWNVTGRSG